MLRVRLLQDAGPQLTPTPAARKGRQGIPSSALAVRVGVVPRVQLGRLLGKVETPFPAGQAVIHQDRRPLAVLEEAHDEHPSTSKLRSWCNQNVFNARVGVVRDDGCRRQQVAVSQCTLLPILWRAGALKECGGGGVLGGPQPLLLHCRADVGPQAVRPAEVWVSPRLARLLEGRLDLPQLRHDQCQGLLIHRLAPISTDGSIVYEVSVGSLG